MTRVTRETVVRAPPEAVWAALADPAERARWLTSMRESAEGALAVGSRIPARRAASGSTSSYELTVTALDAPRRLETAIRRNGSPAGKAGYELTPLEGGAATLARAFAEYELPLLQRMLAPVVSASLEREMDADLASLKRHVEARAAAASP